MRLLQRLLDWQDRQGDLIAFLEQLRSQGLTITPLTDQDAKGARFLLQEIDPFTFFGVFNRGIRKEQRLAIVAEVIKLLGVQSALPKDFEGLPILNAQNSWFISFQPGRKAYDVQNACGGCFDWLSGTIHLSRRILCKLSMRRSKSDIRTLI